jgi:hypothetical protein
MPAPPGLIAVDVQQEILYRKTVEAYSVRLRVIGSGYGSCGVPNRLRHSRFGAPQTQVKPLQLPRTVNRRQSQASWCEFMLAEDVERAGE